MTPRDNGKREVEDLLERYMQFLRGEAPEPNVEHLPLAQRRDALDRFAFADALFGIDPHRPPIEQDPVAIRLGLVSGPPPPGDSGGGASQPPGFAPADPQPAVPTGGPDGVGIARTEGVPGRIHTVLLQLETSLRGQMAVNWSPSWSEWRRPNLEPVAECTVLGDSTALFLTTDEAGRFEDSTYFGDLAEFLYRHPEMSTVGVVSRDATRAAILPAAACSPALDPMRGWLEPGAYVRTADFSLTMAHYFESRLPRWERIVGLNELRLNNDNSERTLIHEVVTGQINVALRAKPRLQHKKEAQEALSRIDSQVLADLIASIQSGAKTGTQLVDELELLTVGSSS